MGTSKRFTTEGNQEAPREVEGTVHDNGGAPGGMLLPTEYRRSRSLCKH